MTGKDGPTPKQVPLQVLQVKVCLVAVGAFELVVCILDRVRRRLGGGRRAAWMGGQNAAAPLLANDMYGFWLLLVGECWRVLIHVVGET